MSDASMPFQPAIDEPSKAWPDSNLSSSKCEMGTVTCCSLPRVSAKRKSTNLTSLSFSICITSAAVLAIRILLIEKGVSTTPHGACDRRISVKAEIVPALGHEQINNHSLEDAG